MCTKLLTYLFPALDQWSALFPTCRVTNRIADIVIAPGHRILRGIDQVHTFKLTAPHSSNLDLFYDFE